MSTVNLYEKLLNTRECIEETILHFNPDISDKDLLDLREKIYLYVWGKSSGCGAYIRDYHLYSRRKSVL